MIRDRGKTAARNTKGKLIPTCSEEQGYQTPRYRLKLNQPQGRIPRLKKGGRITRGAGRPLQPETELQYESKDPCGGDLGTCWGAFNSMRDLWTIAADSKDSQTGFYGPVVLCYCGGIWLAVYPTPRHPRSLPDRGITPNQEGYKRQEPLEVPVYHCPPYLPSNLQAHSTPD